MIELNEAELREISAAADNTLAYSLGHAIGSGIAWLVNEPAQLFQEAVNRLYQPACQ